MTRSKSKEPSDNVSAADGRVAVVTGANRGIGLEVCRQLAAKGLQVILASRDAAKGQEAAQSVSGRVTVHQLDVTDAHSIRRFASDIEAAFGRVDVLVNNAAILIGEDASVLDCDVDDFRGSMETNVYGPFLPAQ